MQVRSTKQRLSTRADRWWFRGALGVALLPFAVSAVTLAVADRGYQAYGDRALTELMIREVGGGFPEVGPFSINGWFHPGPMLFYVLAAPYRLLGGRSVSMLISIVLLNALVVLGIGLVARRRAGTPFAVMVLCATAVLCHSVGASLLRDPWNPFVLVLPFVLLVLLAWCVMEGDVWMLPWTAVTASFIVQNHVGTLLTVLAIVATAVVGLALHRRATPEPRPAMKRPVALAIGVAGLLWFPPILDAAAHSGGNLRRLWDYFRGAHVKTALGVGIRTVAAQLTVRPPWIRGNAFPIKLLSNSYAYPKAPVPLLGVALVLGTLVAWRCRERSAARLGALVLVALAAATVTFARVPNGLQWWYVAWVPSLGMLAGVATLWTFWRAYASRERVSRRFARVSVLAGAGVLLVPAVLLTAAAADPARVPDGSTAAGIADLRGPLLRSLRGVHGPVLVRYRNVMGGQPSVMVLIDQHGGVAVADPANQWFYPASSRVHGRRVAAVLTVVSPSAMGTYQPSPDERLVAGTVRRPPPLPTTLTTAQLEALARKAQSEATRYALFLRVEPASRR